MQSQPQINIQSQQIQQNQQLAQSVAQPVGVYTSSTSYQNQQQVGTRNIQFSGQQS